MKNNVIFLYFPEKIGKYVLNLYNFFVFFKTPEGETAEALSRTSNWERLKFRSIYG